MHSLFKQFHSWPSFINILGTSSLTVFVRFEAFASVQPGEAIYISTVVESVGSTGSDKKVKWLVVELGIDHAFNYKYKSIKLTEAWKKYGPIDIYWDNVGGETLGAAIDHSAYKGRIIMCLSSCTTIRHDASIHIIDL